MPTIETIEPPQGAVVRFVSDLHLGHERCEVPSISALAETLLQGIHMLVLVGDAAETRVCDWQARGKALREELRHACQEKNVQLVEIAGNHDPDTEPLLIRFWGGKVVAMHGHALYKEVAPWSWEYLLHKNECHKLIANYADSDTNLVSRLELSRAMCQLTPPILRRKGIKNKYLRGLLHCFWPPQRPLNIIRCWLTCGKRANHFAERFFPEAQTVVLGHFHRSGHWRFKNRHIYNTGAWFKHATPYCLDMQDASVLSYKKLILKKFP
ncbi:MAG: hypothetical protein IJ993_02225 [Akkermansia sp.]|nr:hypothetical protein [Akkermansia sp.]